jgi:hypothetical protein
MIRKSERVLAGLIALMVVASVAAAVDISTPSARPAAVVTLPDPASLVATLGDRLPTPPPPTTLPEPETTTTAPRVPTRAATPAARPIGSLASTAAAGIAPYAGLGTWVDVYDWTVTYTRESAPEVGPETVGAMADAGVQTIFIQASKHDAPTDVVEEDRLLAIVGAARARNLRVVAWYLPTLVDPAADLRRLLAIAALPFDGLGVDIEARQVSDVAERNRRLVDLSAALRSALPGRALAGIVLPPVIMEEVNPNYWPDFPWRAIAPYYDVWQTMGYWTDRKASSGWRDAYAYTMENVLRLRRNIGQPEAPVHPIGGIGHQTSEGDVAAFRQAASDSVSIGGSLYDWRTTGANLWPALQAFRV